MTSLFRHFPQLVLIASVICVPLLPVSKAGDEKDNKPGRRKNANSAQRDTAGRLTPEQVSDALKFARQHHPELAELLHQLRKTSPVGFSRGIREIHLTTQRIERFRQKQPARLQFEIDNWKIDSKIRLLTARWAMSQDPSLEQEIRDLLRQRQQARLDRLKAERERVMERLQQLDSQIGMGTDELDEALEAEWSRLARRANAAAGSRKRAAARDKDQAEGDKKSRTAKDRS